MSIPSAPKPSTLVRVLRSASAVPREQWDAIARRGYHRHAWFVAAEACGAEARHIGVFDRMTLVAVIPAYIERETLHGDLHARWFGPASRAAAAIGAGLRPSLAIGAPMSTGSDPLGSSTVLTDDILEQALTLLEEEARDEHLKAIVWPFVEDSDVGVREVARRLGFRESFANSEAVIDVEWSSPEEYIASRSKNVRRTLRNELAWVHDQGIRVSWETDLREHAATFDAFYRASYAARNGKVAALAPNFFAELAVQQSPGIRVQCAWRGSSLLEMAVALDGGGALDLCLSAQSEETRNGLLYQHCLCYDPIRAAIAGGLARIHLGPSALHPKVLRGARLTTRLTLARGITPVARAAVAVLSRATDARNRAKQRRLLGKLRAAAS
ncbi:MAG: peptidogalycan biosysnthesis protein [Gemmatimonadota bacterium]